MSKKANKETIKMEQNRKLIKVDTVDVPNFVSKKELREMIKQNQK